MLMFIFIPRKLGSSCFNKLFIPTSTLYKKSTTKLNYNSFKFPSKSLNSSQVVTAKKLNVDIPLLSTRK